MRRLTLLLALLAAPACQPAGPPATGLPTPGAGLAAPASPGPASPPAEPHTTLAVEQAACRAFAGQGLALTAAEAPAEAPALTPGRRHDVSLQATRGHLALTVPRSGEWSIMLDRDHFFLVQDLTGAVMFSVEDGGASAQCEGIARHAVFALDAGVAYRLELAPGTGAPLKLFVGETHPAP